MESETYITLNRAWKSTCKVLFGEEVGELEDFEGYLKEIIDANVYYKSSISGKEITFAIKDYDKKAKFISFDEIDFGKKYEPFNINQIKDIDSLLEVVNERISYCGDINLGNCHDVEQSSSISDGFCVYDSAQFFNVKYMAFCTVGRENSYCFGSHALGGSEFIIRCCQTTWAKRSFESWLATNTVDSYYCYGLDGCSNCLFSFNLKNKRNTIGNLELNKDKFESIKKKLLAEIADELRTKKSAPSLLDIVRKSKSPKPQSIIPAVKKERLNKQIIEREFLTTSRLIFGKELVGIDNYSKWLFEHVHKIEETKSAVSNERILIVPYGVSLLPLPADKMVTLEEAEQLSNLTLDQNEAESLTLKNVYGSIGKIAYLKAEMKSGQNRNMIDCTYYMDCSDCYQISMTIEAKYCGCSMWPKTSQNCFGVDSIMNSSFCFKCYHSTNLTRCFEMDNCRSCTDSMFCHNSENLTNCMFCFNTKSKRYAIGNVELPKEKYLEIKQRILGELIKKLEQNKKLEISIFNLCTK
ncbi:MAG: hypothetical protein Q7S22_03370 [Candidatus Micrarchaeota archaeon]|nr:hypothetical protein [Candidatus Micrarchaeota archaeon]